MGSRFLRTRIKMGTQGGKSDKKLLYGLALSNVSQLVTCELILKKGKLGL